MSLTASTMLELGTQLPDFSLPDARTGSLISAPKAHGQPVLVMFICCHCPYVIHVREQLARIGKDYQGYLEIIAISSNDADNYPADSPAKLKEMADQLGFTFPVCHDATQNVAKEFGAACTPDFFLFDRRHKLAYRGQLDASRKGNDLPVDGRDLRAAMDAVLADKSTAATQIPSIGCNIKWKPGNEPVYYASALVKK